jgi:protein-disulfide isomerase
MEPQETNEENVQESPQQAAAEGKNEAASAEATASQSKKQGINIAAAIVTCAAMIAIALVLILRPAPTTPSAAQPTTPAATATVDSNNVHTAGEPFIGSATAPVTIAYWFDYQCPFCKQNELTTMPEIVSNYVDTGKVKIVFKDYAFLGSDSQTLGQYGRAVWAVDPAKFGAWHDAIFAAQGTENSGWATQKEILSVTNTVLGSAESQKVAQLVATNGDTYQAEMDADKAEAGTFGIQGTPAFIIGTQEITGAQPYAQFQAAINAALSAKN